MRHGISHVPCPAAIANAGPYCTACLLSHKKPLCRISCFSSHRTMAIIVSILSCPSCSLPTSHMTRQYQPVVVHQRWRKNSCRQVPARDSESPATIIFLSHNVFALHPCHPTGLTSNSAFQSWKAIYPQNIFVVVVVTSCHPVSATEDFHTASSSLLPVSFASDSPWEKEKRERGLGD